MKILNLYCGIGGNRKLWTDCEVTAVEWNPEIAKIYQDFFPDDKVIVTDAHQYLLDHYKEYDFIWSSPPCPTHSRLNIPQVLSDSRRAGNHLKTANYPDMKLYEEIILLTHFAPLKTKWVVENVQSYYEPLIKPKKLGRHYFWMNFQASEMIKEKDVRINDVHECSTVFGFDLKKYKIDNKRKILRNMVDPQLGLHIFKEAFTPTTLF